MRSTNEILIAVKECGAVSPEELRMALLVLNAVEHCKSNKLDALIQAVEDGKTSVAKLRASFAKDIRSRMFQAMKADPVEWLGPANIPGNPEYEERYRAALALGKKADVL